MHMISLCVACLAFAGQSRRLQSSAEPSQSGRDSGLVTLEPLASLLFAVNPSAPRISPVSNRQSPVSKRYTQIDRAALALRPRVALPASLTSRHGAVLAQAFTETTLRSAVKAVGWRITAGIVTAITSYIFTKSLAMVMAIVGWDLCSKSVTMFLGERLWNKFDWGKDSTKGEDSAKRSVAKALAWRAFAAVNTFIGATVLSKGKAGAAGKIAGADSVFKTILFYFYERIWAAVAWGKIYESIANDSDASTES